MANKTVGDLFATLQATTTAVTALQNALTPFVDGLEGFTDGIEGSIGVSTDSAATAGGTGTVISNLRRLTADLDAIKTTIGTISGNVDGLEGFTDGLETLATALNGFVDGLEGSLGATTDAAVTAGAAGSINAKLRQMSADIADLKTAITAIKDTSGIKRIEQGVTLSGATLQEQKNESDASGGSVSFSNNISAIEIYNTSVSDGTFTVNGIAIKVPKGEVFGPVMVGGTPGLSVSVSGAATYVISRYA